MCSRTTKPRQPPPRSWHRTLLLRSHAVVIAAVCGFALSCWNTRRLEGSICCSKTFIYLSAFIVPSKTCKPPIPYALMHPHTIRDAGFWTFLLRGVLTFVASGLDINDCVLSYFEGTVNLHCYTSYTLTTLHCSKVSFLQCCHMKRQMSLILQKCEGCIHTHTHTHTRILHIQMINYNKQATTAWYHAQS